MTTTMEPQTAETPRVRRTKLQRHRRSIDLIVAAYHYFHEPRLGLRRLARHFQIPRSTVRGMLARVDRNDPEVRHTAIRFGLMRLPPLGAVPARKDDGGLVLDLSPGGGTARTRWPDTGAGGVGPSR